jgi:hypothetical protein
VGRDEGRGLSDEDGAMEGSVSVEDDIPFLNRRGFYRFDGNDLFLFDRGIHTATGRTETDALALLQKLSSQVREEMHRGH